MLNATLVRFYDLLSIESSFCFADCDDEYISLGEGSFQLTLLLILEFHNKKEQLVIVLNIGSYWIAFHSLELGRISVCVFELCYKLTSGLIPSLGA